MLFPEDKLGPYNNQMKCPKCSLPLEPGDSQGLCSSCLLAAAFAPDEDDTLPPQQSLPKYKLIRILGEGGMGTVHLAEQTHPLVRQVALKVVKLGMDSAQVLARFNYERQSLAIMDHPAIARIFDAGIDESGRPFFAMEYVDGIPVTQYCDKHQLTIKDRLNLFLLICDGVQHAHRKGVIHRDIKPSNILVAELNGKPVPKVIDFGIAKAIQQPDGENTAFTQLGQFIGTPEYMSPEQADWVAGAIDTSTDVYSLGILLYELLSGTVPFDPQSLRQAGFTELIRIIREQEPPPMQLKLTPASATLRHTDPNSLRKHLSGDLSWIVAKAIEKLPSSRYSSVADFAADIERHLNDQPVLASPPSTFNRTRKFVRRNKLAVFAAVSVFVTLLAGLAATAWQAKIANQQRAQALAQQAIAEAQTKEAALQQSRALSAERLALAGQQAAERQTAIALSEKRRADSEAAIARAVSDFLQKDLLAQADVRNQSATFDRDIKVRTALDRAALKLSNKFDKQPLIEASIRQTIASAYFNLSLLPESRTQINRADDLFLRHLGPAAPATLSALNQKCTTIYSQGKLPEAESALIDGLSLARRSLGASHPTTLALMQSLGDVYERQGKAKASEQIRLSTYELVSNKIGTNHPDTVEALDKLVSSYTTRGALDLAYPLSEKAIAILTAKLGPEHPDTLRATTTYTIILARLGRSEEAERRNTRAVEICRRVFGLEGAITQVFMNSLANNYMELGRFAQAQALYAETLDLKTRTLGPSNPTTLITMMNLATSYVRQRKYPQAEELYIKTLDLRRKQLGPEHPSTLVTTSALAATYNRQSKFAQAETLFRQLIDVQRRVQGPAHPATLDSLRGLGKALLGLENYTAAQTLYTELLPLQIRGLGADHDTSLDVMSELAGLYLSQSAFTKAEPLLVQVLETSRRKLPAKHTDISDAALDLAELYLKSGNLENAARLAQQAADASPNARQSEVVRTWIEDNLKKSAPNL